MYKKIWLAVCVTVAVLLSPFCMNASAASVSARSAILLHPLTKTVLFEKDAHRPMAMASTTKLMTALLAAETLPLDRELTVPAEAVLVEGSSLGLRGGDTLTVSDLITGLLLVSGNDAANVVAFAVDGSLSAFADRMNEKATALGMKNTVFVTPSGLDEGDHHSTAYDMALLGAAVLENETLAAVCRTKQATIRISGTSFTLTNHNKLLSMYDGCIGLKNGFTKKAGRCLVSAATRNNETLVAVTLNGGDYWNDHIALYNEGFSALTETTLTVPPLSKLSVSGGTDPSVSLTAQAPTLSLPTSVVGEVTARVVCPPFAWAPLKAGQTVGRVVWEYDGNEIATADVVTKTALPARPPLSDSERFWRLFWECVIALLSKPD